MTFLNSGKQNCLHLLHNVYLYFLKKKSYIAAISNQLTVHFPDISKYKRPRRKHLIPPMIY